MEADGLREELTPNFKKAVDLATEKERLLKLADSITNRKIWLLPAQRCIHPCSSIWMGPVKDANHLHMWGHHYCHALSCPCGGFASLHHNEIRNLTATLLTKVCNDVRLKPDLQKITTETMARHSANTMEGEILDFSANGFWGGTFEKMFLNVREFNSHAPSNKNASLNKCFWKHKLEQKKANEQRVREVEHVSNPWFYQQQVV